MRLKAVLAVLCIILPAAAAAAPAGAAAKPVRPRRVFPGELIELTTRDGWTLKAKYSPAREGQRSFILLHGTGGRKENWYRLARPLALRGYGVLALDLRGHGESTGAPPGRPAVWRKFLVNKEFEGVKKYNEFINMSADIDAAVSFLIGQGVVAEQIGLIGADVGGSLALRYAALHPAVCMVAMLSPGLTYQEVTTVNAMRAYRQRPILLMYSEADKRSAKETPILYSFARMAAGESNVTLLTAPTEHGTKMLRGETIGRLVDWVVDPAQVAVSTGTEGSAQTGPAGEEDDAADSEDGL